MSTAENLSTGNPAFPKNSLITAGFDSIGSYTKVERKGTEKRGSFNQANQVKIVRAEPGSDAIRAILTQFFALAPPSVEDAAADDEEDMTRKFAAF